MAENPKGELMARLSARGLPAPVFAAHASGPAHEPTFGAEVRLGAEVLGEGTGRSKRQAERAASAQALARLDQGDLPLAGLGAGLGAGLDRAGLDRAEAGWRGQAADSPWPIYASVLAEALAVADGRAPQGATLDHIGRAAADLYRQTLAELGHGPQAADAAGQP